MWSTRNLCRMLAVVTTPVLVHTHTHTHATACMQGSTIVLRDRGDASAQEFLQGHTGKVSCLALSPSGRLLATGQCTYLGFQAGTR